MRRTASILIITAMLLAVLLSLTTASAAEPKFSTDKTVYKVGEPIMVTASSDNAGGTDWVGITPKDKKDLGNLTWIYTKDTSTTFDIRKAPNWTTNKTLIKYETFPAGEYLVYFMPNDLNFKGNEDKALGVIEIVIENDDRYPVKAPIDANYYIYDLDSGISDGVINITLPAEHGADDIEVWWGDENGRLAGYTMLARFKAPTKNGPVKFYYELDRRTFIPAGATRLMIYSCSDEHGESEVVYSVPLGNAQSYGFPEGEPLLEFEVISDTHVHDETSAANFKNALKDIALNSPNSAGIFLVGDMVENGGDPAQWEQFWDTYDSVGAAPEIYLGIGDHDLLDYASYGEAVESFISQIRMPEGADRTDGVPYYDLWLGDYHFIVLGDADGLAEGETARIGEAQYDWLEEKLSEDNNSRPVFLFMHQSLKATVAGSAVNAGRWGIEDGERLQKILDSHPEIVMFNGHSHWTLDADNSIYAPKNSAAIFNTASVSYLWQSYDLPTGERLEGSQGYYVKVYKDSVVVLGRDFANGKWVSSAQFVLEDKTTPEKIDTNELEKLIKDAEAIDKTKYTEKSYNALAVVLEGAKKALSATAQTEIDGAEKSLAAAIGALEEIKTNGDGEETAPPETPKPTEESTTAPEDKGGCGSSFSALGVLLVCTAGASLVLKKRR
ncbi:MAG: metallophosphoesterase [Clostridia bacterium]|nr:metallophosphoesterase [Clostridia bacterium]